MKKLTLLFVSVILIAMTCFAHATEAPIINAISAPSASTPPTDTLKLYPTIVTNELHIVTSAGIPRNATVLVFDGNGQLAYKGYLNSGIIYFDDGARYPARPGKYYLTVLSESGRTIRLTQSFIKMH